MKTFPFLCLFRFFISSAFAFHFVCFSAATLSSTDSFSFLFRSSFHLMSCVCLDFYDSARQVSFIVPVFLFSCFACMLSVMLEPSCHVLFLVLRQSKVELLFCNSSHTVPQRIASILHLPFTLLQTLHCIDLISIGYKNQP